MPDGLLAGHCFLNIFGLKSLWKISVKCYSLGIVGTFGDVSVVVQESFQWQFLVSLSLGLWTDILEFEREFHCQEIEREMWLLAVTLYIMLDGTFL